MKNKAGSGGIATFLIIWIGQVASLIGTAMTAFAFSIWIFRTTGQVTPLALVSVCNFGAMMILSPLAGALVDRWDRRLIMIISDLSACLATVCLFFLFISNQLEFWHLYGAAIIAGAANAFHLTAYSSSITMLIPKKHFTRASSLVTMAEPASQIFSPIIAGALLATININGILLIDIFSCLFAVFALVVNKIPQPPRSEEGLKSKGNLLKESLFGIKYIFSVPSLLAVTMMVFIKNLLDSFVMVVQGPLILVRTNDSANMMASILSVEAIGGFVGGILLSLWGGPKKKINGIQLGILIGGFFGLILMAIGKTPVFWFFAAFCFGFQVPLIVNSYRTILITKVSPDIQGRVISSSRFISAISLPLSMLLGAPLVDFLFEPAMKAGTPAATFFAPLLGSGKGAGMALLYLIAGILCILIVLIGYLIPSYRNADSLLKDYDSKEKDEPLRDEALLSKD